MNNLFNEITENFQNFKNEMKNQTQEVYTTPNIQNYNTPSHNSMKMPNIQNKYRILLIIEF